MRELHRRHHVNADASPILACAIPALLEKSLGAEAGVVHQQQPAILERNRFDATRSKIGIRGRDRQAIGFRCHVIASPRTRSASDRQAVLAPRDQEQIVAARGQLCARTSRRCRWMRPVMAASGRSGIAGSPAVLLLPLESDDSARRPFRSGHTSIDARNPKKINETEYLKTPIFASSFRLKPMARPAC